MGAGNESASFDLAVIGGGINGCGIARDAAGRGAWVVLLEQDDIGGGTSSASTKLIHGGLRYLESYQFRLVREALIEREVLWRAAPHIVSPLRFILPHHQGLRPAWLLRLGLFLYDHLGGRRLLPGTRMVDLARDEAGAPLKPGFRRAFEYSDCWVDDARLVALNAQDAARRGADIRPRTRVVAAFRLADRWELRLQHGASAREETVTARVLVNAAGPWVREVSAKLLGADAPYPVRLVKGSHIVVPRMFAHQRCYIFQNADGRIVFAIPYEGDFTLIGTTDVDYSGDPSSPAATDQEISYLCAAASEYFAAPIRCEDVVWTYAGIRPLYDDGATSAQEASRDYILEFDHPDGRAPLLSIIGGKITTYRRLAEAALAKLAGVLPAAAAPPWTGSAALPGGDFPHDGRAALVAAVLREHPYLDPPVAERLVRAYGTRVRDLLRDVRSAAGLGRSFGAGLTEREVSFLMREEWATTADDVLWRRSKLGLRVSDAQKAALAEFMQGAAVLAAPSAA